MILCTDRGGNILLILQTNISSELKSTDCSISTINTLYLYSGEPIPRVNYTKQETETWYNCLLMLILTVDRYSIAFVL